jgi:hypothetical protein
VGIGGLADGLIGGTYLALLLRLRPRRLPQRLEGAVAVPPVDLAVVHSTADDPRYSPQRAAAH